MIAQAPLVIYAESTPNPNAMMFVANRNIVDPEVILEFNSPQEATDSPLAAALFKFPFITGVFITRNFITLTKNDEISWNALVLEMREFLKEFIGSGKDVFNGDASSHQAVGKSETGNDQKKAAHREAANPLEQRIIDVLEEYVRPAVEGDGGAIHFSSFSDGIVKVELRGACSGCPSSTITLKAGIQALLQRMVPEVKEVVAESY